MEVTGSHGWWWGSACPRSHADSSRAEGALHMGHPPVESGGDRGERSG